MTLDDLRALERGVHPIPSGGAWSAEVEERVRAFNGSVATFREIVVRARNAIVRGAPLAPGSEERLRDLARELVAEREDIVRSVG